MVQGKHNLINEVSASLHELQHDFGRHCRLVNALLVGEQDGAAVRPLLGVCPQQSRLLLMKDSIREAIDVLEESRKAFKSKQLELLRKKLTRVLIDAG
jgi:hypothetical protein